MFTVPDSNIIGTCRWQVMIGLIAELAGYVWLIGLVGGATSGELLARHCGDET